jgi:hypothetical protein
MDIRLRAKAKALLGCLDNSDICVFFPLKTLVLAVLAAAAIIQALDSGCSVDAVRIFSTCVIDFSIYV